MKIKAIAAAILIAGLLSGCSAPQSSAQRQLAGQATLAVNWMQQSGEYQALCWQAFNAAKTSFLNSQVDKGMHKAVIVDLDETMLDNSAYAAWQVKNSRGYSERDWSEWVDSRRATAISGAVEFSHFVNDNGGKIFYVSNRSQQNYASTVANLKALGFAGVSGQTVLLKGSDGSNKITRFNQIQDSGYMPVVYIGDNLNDFSGETWGKNNQQRKAFVQQNRQRFGTQFIILPNPDYGDWESGMAKNYSHLSTEEKLKVRAERLQAWVPDN